MYVFSTVLVVKRLKLRLLVVMLLLYFTQIKNNITINQILYNLMKE